jgi:hypothetical protein
MEAIRLRRNQRGKHVETRISEPFQKLAFVFSDAEIIMITAHLRIGNSFFPKQLADKIENTIKSRGFNRDVQPTKFAPYQDP